MYHYATLGPQLLFEKMVFQAHLELQLLLQ